MHRSVAPLAHCVCGGDCALAGRLRGRAGFRAARCAGGRPVTRREPLAEQTSSADVPGGEAQRFVQGWTFPASGGRCSTREPLNALIEQALKANPTLPAAQAALRQAWENVYAGRRARSSRPRSQLLAEPQQDRDRRRFHGGLLGHTLFHPLHRAGRSCPMRRTCSAARGAQVEVAAGAGRSQRFQLEAAYLTLTSNVVAAAVQEASLRGQIAATEEIIKIERQSLDILRRQLALGQVAGADVAAQEAALAQAQATLPPLQKQLAQQRDLLTALVGRFPSQEPAETFELASLQLPQDLPVSLPSKLVEQRPDIRAAEAQLHAASAQIGVAIADRLPQITLTGNAGTSREPDRPTVHARHRVLDPRRRM